MRTVILSLVSLIIACATATPALPPVHCLADLCLTNEMQITNQIGHGRKYPPEYPVNICYVRPDGVILSVGLDDETKDAVTDIVVTAVPNCPEPQATTWSSPIASQRGIKIGDSLSRIRELYGSDLVFAEISESASYPWDYVSPSLRSVFPRYDCRGAVEEFLLEGEKVVGLAIWWPDC